MCHVYAEPNRQTRAGVQQGDESPVPWANWGGGCAPPFAISTRAHNSYEALQCPNARVPRKLALKNIVLF